MMGGYSSKPKLKQFTSANSSTMLKEEAKDDLANMYTTFMKLGKALLIIPYSVRYDNVKSGYSTKAVSRILAGVIILLQFFYSGHTLYPVVKFGRTFEINTVRALNFGVSRSIKRCVIFMVIMKELIAFKVLWDSKEQVKKILAELSRVSSLTANLCGQFTKKEIMSVKAVLGFTFLVRMAWELFKANSKLSSVQYLNYNEIPVYFAARFRAWYFPGYTLPGDYQQYEIWVGLCVTIVSMYGELFDNFIDLWCLISAIILKISLDKLVSKLSNGDITHNQEDQVLQLIDRLCTLVDLMNNSIQWIYLAQVVITMPYYAAFLMDILYAGGGWLIVVNFVVYFLIYSFIQLIAADTNAKSKEISSWFRSRASRPVGISYHQPLREQIYVILTQIESDSIAFREGPFFILSYNFLGSAISFVITYCVIIMQNIHD